MHLAHTGDLVQLGGSEIEQDPDGFLLSSLSRELMYKGYSISSKKADLRLHVKHVGTSVEQIGYRYDVAGPNQSRSTRLVPNEEQKTVRVSAWVTHDGKTILGPKQFAGVTRYDFIDPNALNDVKIGGENSLEYSFGQLDAVQGARSVSVEGAYSRLSQEIALWLSKNIVNLKAETE